MNWMFEVFPSMYTLFPMSQYPFPKAWAASAAQAKKISTRTFLHYLENQLRATRTKRKIS
jgi:hypothetical protein